MYILIILGIIFFALGYIIKILNGNQETKIEYQVKTNPMTETERNFASTLKIFTDKQNLILIPQVQLQAIFKVKNKRDAASFNKIKSKSVDLAIVDNNYNYKMFIELDDYTHNRNDRIKRDIFVNELFKKYNLKLKRIKVKKDYSEEIENIIKEIAN